MHGHLAFMVELFFFPELKGTKSKCTEGKQWAVGVAEWRGVG